MGSNLTTPIRWTIGLIPAVVGAVGAVGAGPAARGQPAKKLALVGEMLLDGYEVPPLHHAAVLIEGDRGEPARPRPDRARGDPGSADVDERSVDHPRPRRLLPRTRIADPRRQSRDALRATERVARAGVDVIKAYVALGPEHYAAIADAAHAHGLRVHVHVYDPKEVRDALDACVDVLTHVGSAGFPPTTPSS